MNSQNSPERRFHGIIPPLVTPLTDYDTLDRTGLERLLEHVLRGCVHGIFILGSSGEAPSLSYRLRKELIGRVCDQVDGRVPVLVGITDTAFVESLAVAEAAAECGASALVLSTPYYFPAGQTELLRYVEHIVEKLPLPLMLYNMPSLTKVPFEIETLRRLASIDTIVGVKDSGGDLGYFGQLTELSRVRPDWSLLVGPEHLLVDAMRLGGHGGVSGGANIFPGIFTACYEAICSGDDERAAHFAERIDKLQAIYSIGKYGSRFIKAMKCALSILGVCDDFMAEPFNHFLEPERARVRAVLEQDFRDQWPGDLA